MLHLKNYIDGAFVEAQDGQTLEDINPANGQVIATITRSKSSDVESAAVAAKKAQSGWNATQIGRASCRERV